MNCDKDMISNLDAINNDDIVRKENGSSSRIDARNHIRSILKKRCLEWKKRSCPKLRNAELRKACLAKKKEIMRMRRQQYSSSLSTTDKTADDSLEGCFDGNQHDGEVTLDSDHTSLSMTDETSDDNVEGCFDGNQHDGEVTLDSDHTSLSMTDETSDDNVEGCFDGNQDDDEVTLDSDHTSLSMTDETADDSLKPNAEGQPNETMPFHMIRNKSFLLSHYNCGDPPSDSKPFPSNEAFVNLLEGKKQLMYECLRTFYFPSKPLISVSKGMSGYKINGKVYENNATLEDVFQDFHDRFNVKDFHVYEKWNNSYGFKLCPTRNLKMLDKEAHEKWKKEQEETILFMKTKSAEFNTYSQENSFEKLWSEPNVKLCSTLIRGGWQKAWDHMADGELSTNAFLQTASIYQIFDKMIMKNMIQKGVKIADLGSSYGSLLWYTADYLKEFRPILVGYEYSLLRHVWGSQCSNELLEESTKYDICPLHSYQVHLVHHNLLHMNEVGRGIDIAFQFDKAFYIELALHTMFCVLNTESVKYFITCKPNNNFTGWYQDIVQATECFEKVLTIKGCKMNNGESSGNFHVYKKTKTISVTTDYIKKFLADKATAIDNSIVDDVALNWRKAKSLGPDMPFNKTYELDEMKNRYCKAAKDAWTELNAQLQVQRI